MGNSVTRAKVRRRQGLAVAIEQGFRDAFGHRVRPADAQLLGVHVEERLTALGLCVADIGGNRADDDDGVHRMPAGSE